jgi:hypothetical protein
MAFSETPLVTTESNQHDPPPVRSRGIQRPNSMARRAKQCTSSGHGHRVKWQRGRMGGLVGEVKQPLTAAQSRLHRPHQPVPRRPLLHLRDTPDPFPILALLVVRIPGLDLIRIRHRWAGHELILLYRVDVDADVFAHQADTQGMSESADFERFACHGADVVSAWDNSQVMRRTKDADSDSDSDSDSDLPVDHVRVSDHGYDLGITVTSLTALVDVCRAANHQSCERCQYRSQCDADKLDCAELRP